MANNFSPNLHQSPSKHSPFIISLLGLVLLFVIAGCVRNPATRKVHARLLSPETEKKIGEETKKRILAEYQVFESTPVTAYVDKIGQKLADVSDRPTVTYEFIVLDHDLINAFAAPGGFIFITRGLMDNIDDEAELAMVLGHEIAHVAALHSVQMIQKEMGQNALTVLGTIGAALVAGPEAMLMVANTADLFSALYLLGYSREKELEADNLGLQYMLRAGYDPRAALRFLKQLQHGDEKKIDGWDLYFRTHPSTNERIEIIKSMLGSDTLKELEGQTHKAEYQEIKTYLPKIDPEERGSINKQTYINDKHQLTLQIPSNWNLGYYQAQSLVSFQSNDQKGEGRLQVVSISSSVPHAESLAASYSKTMGFKFINGRNVLYSAGYGFLGRFYGLSATGQPLDIRLFATLRNGHGYILMAGAPIDSQGNYALDLEQIIRGFRFTDD